MKPFFQGLVLAGLFAFSNVVGAGVVLVLGKMLQALMPTWQSPWPWFVICGAAAVSAFVFLKGALSYITGARPTIRRAG